MMIEVVAHIRAGINIRVHALTPATPVGIDVHEHVAMAALGGGESGIPALPFHPGASLGSARERACDEARGEGSEAHEVLRAYGVGVGANDHRSILTP